MKKIKPGDMVAPKHAVEAYGSDYGPNKGREILFSPGTYGIVASIAPKVYVPKRTNNPRWDTKPTFLVVDFIDDNGKPQRAALHHCNTVPYVS